jgi:hypothetical protein
MLETIGYRCSSEGYTILLQRKTNKGKSRDKEKAKANMSTGDQPHISGNISQSQYVTNAQIRYLDRLDLYKKEKPYEVTFLPINTTQSAARRSNLSLSPQPVVIRDFSTLRGSFNTDVQGFELDTFHTSLSSSELQRIDSIETLYHQEVKAYLKTKFKATIVHIFDTTVGGLHIYTSKLS